MANKNDALHLKKINSTVQPDNTSYATIKVDDLGRVVYNDENGEKSLAYIEDISGAESQLGDYTLLSTTESISSNLQLQIDNIEEEQTVLIGRDGIEVEEDPTHTWTISVSADFATIDDISDFITTSEVAAITGDFVQKSGDTMTGNLSVPNLLAGDEFDFATLSANQLNFTTNLPGANSYTLKGDSQDYITFDFNEDFERNVIVNKDLIVETLAGNADQIVTLDADGKLQVTGTTLDDINNLSHFDPLIITSDANGINVLSGPEYSVVIQKAYGNLIAIDADVGTYDEIEIGISSEWTESQVGTFRLDLDVKSGQTFTFSTSIEGIADVTLPPISGSASLLFDKPYGTTTWYVRQSI